MTNHLRTAHEYGVQKALEERGYKTAAEVLEEAKALGLVGNNTKTASANGVLDDLFRSLGK
jgi:hypothetical protein